MHIRFNNTIKYIFISLMVFICSCYKNYYQLSIDNGSSACSTDSSKIAFFKFIRLIKPAKGIAALPDGGRPKVLFQEASLFTLDIADGRVEKIFSFEDIPYNRARWQTMISIDQNLLIFGLQPVSGWEWEVSKKFVPVHFQNKYAGIFIYNMTNQNIEKVSPSCFQKYIKPGIISFDQLEKFTNNFKISDLGVQIANYCPKTKRSRILQIIEIKGDINYRKAILELIIHDLDKSEIERMIESIQKYGNSLSSIEKINYFNAQEKILEQLKALL